MSRELFSEQQAAEILRRAVELQEKAGDPDRPYSPGITETELEAIARESGVDLDFLRQAIIDARSGVPAPGVSTPDKDTFEYVVEGELPPEHADVLLEVAKPIATTTAGTAVAMVGRSVSYTAATNSAYLKINASARGGRTRITVTHDHTVAALVSILPGFFVALMGTIIGLRTMGPLGLIWPILAITGAWYLYQFMVKKGRAQAAQTAERMRDHVQDELAHLNQERASTPVMAEERAALEQRLGQE